MRTASVVKCCPPFARCACYEDVRQNAPQQATPPEMAALLIASTRSNHLPAVDYRLGMTGTKWGAASLVCRNIWPVCKLHCTDFGISSVNGLYPTKALSLGLPISYPDANTVRTSSQIMRVYQSTTPLEEYKSLLQTGLSRHSASIRKGFGIIHPVGNQDHFITISSS